MDSDVTTRTFQLDPLALATAILQIAHNKLPLSEKRPHPARKDYAAAPAHLDSSYGASEHAPVLLDYAGARPPWARHRDHRAKSGLPRVKDKACMQKRTLHPVREALNTMSCGDVGRINFST